MLERQDSTYNRPQQKRKYKYSNVVYTHNMTFSIYSAENFELKESKHRANAKE